MQKAVVLAIDDRVEVLSGISEMLHEEYDIRAVKSAAAAMNLLRSEKVDLILLDIDMPVLSGLDFFTFIRHNSGTLDIPVVFITAVSDPAVIKKAQDSNAAGLIAKPFTPELLRSKIQSVLAA
jgi:putative two-component system response regulator